MTRMAVSLNENASTHTDQDCQQFTMSTSNDTSINNTLFQNSKRDLSMRGKKTRRTKEEVGRQHQGMDRPGVHKVPEGSGEQGKMEKTGCKVICSASTTLAVKGLMMMMMIMNPALHMHPCIIV